MVHAPVVNIVEAIFLMRGRGQGARVQAATPHSPAQVLPAANYSTVLDRRRAWTVGNGSGKAGSNIDPLGVINPSPARSWGCIAMVKDALMMNNNMVCQIERQVAARADAADRTGADAATVPGVFHMNCACHSTVLCMKPIVHRIHKGITAFIVRLGHLSQSSRVFGRIMDAMARIVESSFECRKALTLPDAAVEWRARAVQILYMTQCSMDLSGEQKAEILRYDNGCWDDHKIVHWCQPRCPCGEAREEALNKTKGVVMMSLGSGCDLALEYRWRYMERGLGWAVCSGGETDGEGEQSHRVHGGRP